MKNKLYISIIKIIAVSVLVFNLTAFSVNALIEKFFYNTDKTIIFLQNLIVITISILCSILILRYLAKKLSEKISAPITDFANQIENFTKGNHDILNISSEYDEFHSIAENISGLSQKIDKYKGRWRSESEKMVLIFENMIEGMVILDENGYIININKSAVNMLTNDGHIAGMTHISTLTDCKELVAFLSDNEKSRTIEDITLDNGKKVYAYANRVKIAQNDCIIFILTDVSQKFDAEHLRREFSANVSHELKTPLTTIRGFGELFGSGMITDTEDIKKYGARIQQESQRLLFLINDIIRLSELDENTEIITSSINLMDIAKESAEMLSNKAQSADVNVIVDGDNELYCMCNENHIRELFTNLIDNAIKYNKKGGYVKVTVYSRGDGQSVISVKDNGIGIPEDDTERIFERFYRVDKSHSRQTGGTGLGLSIVKHIVAYHKGNVNLQSKLGEGTEITVIIPDK